MMDDSDENVGSNDHAIQKSSSPIEKNGLFLFFNILKIKIYERKREG